MWLSSNLFHVLKLVLAYDFQICNQGAQRVEHEHAWKVVKSQSIMKSLYRQFSLLPFLPFPLNRHSFGTQPHELLIPDYAEHHHPKVENGFLTQRQANLTIVEVHGTTGQRLLCLRLLFESFVSEG